MSMVCRIQCWETFRDIVKKCTKNVCGMRLVGGQRRRWSEDVGVEVSEKRRAFEVWMQRRKRDSYDRLEFIWQHIEFW